MGERHKISKVSKMSLSVIIVNVNGLKTPVKGKKCQNGFFYIEVHIIK